MLQSSLFVVKGSNKSFKIVFAFASFVGPPCVYIERKLVRLVLPVSSSETTEKTGVKERLLYWSTFTAKTFDKHTLFIYLLMQNLESRI